MSRFDEQQGFTLVEVLVVALLVGVLATMVVPSANRVLTATRQRIEAVEYEVCMANCAMTKQLYSDFLLAMRVEHSDEMFREFLYRLDRHSGCAQGGSYFWYNGDAHCDLHQRVSDPFRQCELVRLTITRQYDGFLKAREVEHNDVLFHQFTQDHWDGGGCPNQGTFTFADGHVRCVHHEQVFPVDPIPPDDVPFL